MFAVIISNIAKHISKVLVHSCKYCSDEVCLDAFYNKIYVMITWMDNRDAFLFKISKF